MGEISKGDLSYFCPCTCERLWGPEYVAPGWEETLTCAREEMAEMIGMVGCDFDLNIMGAGLPPDKNTGRKMCPWACEENTIPNNEDGNCNEFKKELENYGFTCESDISFLEESWMEPPFEKTLSSICPLTCGCSSITDEDESNGG